MEANFSKKECTYAHVFKVGRQFFSTLKNQNSGTKALFKISNVNFRSVQFSGADVKIWENSDGQILRFPWKKIWRRLSEPAEGKKLPSFARTVLRLAVAFARASIRDHRNHQLRRSHNKLLYNVFLFQNSKKVQACWPLASPFCNLSLWIDCPKCRAWRTRKNLGSTSL